MLCTRSKKLLVTRTSLLGARTLLGAPGLTTRSNELLVTPFGKSWISYFESLPVPFPTKSPVQHRAGNLKLYWQALGSNAEALHQRLGAMCSLAGAQSSLCFYNCFAIAQ